MKGKFYQYFCSLLFVLLTVLGWYYGQLQQYVSVNNKCSFHISTDISNKADNASEKASVLIKEHLEDDVYNIIRPHYTKIRANLSENENENEDNVETLVSSEILSFFRDRFWHLTSDFVTFYDSQIAVSLAQSEHLKPLHDDLYIQYQVIRL